MFLSAVTQQLFFKIKFYTRSICMYFAFDFTRVFDVGLFRTPQHVR